MAPLAPPARRRKGPASAGRSAKPLAPQGVWSLPRALANRPL